MNISVTNQRHIMQNLNTALKIKISITIIWVLISLLIAGGASEYFGEFIGVTVAINLPAIIYWLGFWIWGDAYFLRALKRIFRPMSLVMNFINLEIILRVFFAVVTLCFVVGVMNNIQKAIFTPSNLSSSNAMRNMDSTMNLINLALGIWAANWSYNFRKKNNKIGNSPDQYSAKKYKKTDRTTVYCLAFFILLAIVVGIKLGNQIPFIMGEGLGYLIVCYLVVRIFSKFTKYALNENRNCQFAIMLACVLLLYSNWSKIEEQADFNVFISEIKNTTPGNLSTTLINSKSKLGQRIATVIVKRDQLTAVLTDLDDERFAKALVPDTLRNASKIRELLILAQEKKLLALHANQKINDIYQSIMADKEKTIVSNTDIITAFWSGFERRFNEDKVTRYNYALAYSQAYDNLIKLYTLLLDAQNEYSVSDKSVVTFTNSYFSDQYNLYLKGFIDNSILISELSDKSKHKSEEMIKKIQKYN